MNQIPTVRVCELGKIKTSTVELGPKGKQGIPGPPGPPGSENSLTFQDPEKAKAFADDWAALMAVEIEIPGEPLRMEDILTGQLRQTDAHVLRPFLVDE
jgi:hypothetical protein